MDNIKIEEVAPKFKPNTIKGIITPLRSFLTYNNINLKWKKLKIPVAEKIHYDFELQDTRKIILAMKEDSKMIVENIVYYQHLEIKNVFYFY